MAENINRGPKNLHTDSSLVDQPKDTTRFVLNGVNETVEGDRNFTANAEANEECYALPVGYIPLGKTYMRDNKQVILSVSKDETLSEIGIIDNDCNYTTIVNANLGFRVINQIDVTYRLRKGCEDTIYFVTPIPMIFNFSKLEDFKDSLGNWDVDKFKLFLRFSDDPILEDIIVEENGTLKPGSYNASIQYLDEDLNPTEWIVSTSVINIYNDNLSKKYNTIRGSSGKLTDYQNFGVTNKSIKFTFSNLDLDYPFYRVGIIGANNGDGEVNEVNYSQEISTEVKVFNYTGLASVQSQGTQEEIQAFASIIEKAEHIDQIDNMLLLGDTKGKQINYCKLQKYASRIKADLTTKEVILNSVTDSNPKSPTVNFEGVGYMPGEIYSFGIVYKFDDGDISPTFHIPGRNWTVGDPIETAGYYSLMSYDNKCVDTFYTDNSSCDDYWGKDSEGDVLLNQQVRHHRFPLRSEINKPLFTEEIATAPINLEQLILTISGVLDVGYVDDTIEYVVEYEIDGNISFYEGSINTATYDDANSIVIVLTTTSSTAIVNNIFENGLVVATPSAVTGLTYATSAGASTIDVDDKLFKTEIFGVKFSGITVPPKEYLDGREIVGYYIVRNERDEENKSILDTGVLAPLLEEPYFVAHGHIMPNLADTTRIKEDAFALIHPEHRFSSKEYTQTTDLIKEGEYRLLGSPVLSSVVTQDVMAGTSYDADIAKKRERDNDGFSLHTLTRDNEVQYKRVEGVIATSTTLEDLFYLDTLNSKVITDVNAARKEIFNVSGDNKIGIVQLNVPLDKTEVQNKLPYVVMKRTLSNPYGNFRVLDYYKDTPNRTPFLYDGTGNLISGDEISVFGGDVHVTPMRYHSALFYDIRLRKRASKKGIFNIILGALAVIVGAIVTIYGGGPLGIAIIGFGVSQISTGIKTDLIAKVYSELYDAGLRDAVNDDDTTAYFGPNPPDDEIQWLGDVVTNLWFESTANMGLRMGATHNLPDFLNAPDVKAASGTSGTTTINIFGNPYTIVNSAETPQNELDSYLLEKLTLLDSDNENGRLYKGYAAAEIYELNPDYRRINKQKIFFHLGIEYDCCSECIEEFPQRIHFSEQAFQEELSDNYRVFLPNNYKDIEGEKGKMTNIYRLYNNIYIHTEEALWHLPQNYQERVTNDIVSFIGTGAYFDTPPRLIVDDEKSSAGTKHKWGAIKTKHGILFPNQAEKKWYLFDGKSLKALSDDGHSNWFKTNMLSLAANQYYNSNTRDYPFLNNPSNKYGEGFVSTYDTEKERFIVTRKDYSLSDTFIGLTDYEICLDNGELVVFEDFEQTIQDQVDLGYEFIGVGSSYVPQPQIFKNDFLETVTALASFNPGNGIFIENFNGKISTVQGLFKIGSGAPDHDIVAKIYAVDGSNLPITLLETSPTILAATDLTSVLTWYSFDFSGEYDQSIAIIFELDNVTLSDGGNNVLYGVNNGIDTGYGYIANVGTLVSPSWFYTGGSVGSIRVDYTQLLNCQMKFIKTEYVEAQETRTVVTTVSNTADIHIFYDTSGSFGSSGGSCLQSIKDAVTLWVATFGAANPDWVGNVYEYDDGTERWVNYAQRIATETYPAQNLATKDIVVISFCNEASTVYHDGSLDNPIGAPTGSFTSDYNDFLVLHSLYKSFVGIHYPIAFNGSSQSCPPSGGPGFSASSKNFVLHSIAALKGVPMTVSEAENFSVQNPAFTVGEWTTLKTALVASNPYPDDGLENYGWVGKWDRFAPASGPIIDDVQFQEDIDELLQAVVSTIEIDVTIQIPVTTIETIGGLTGDDNPAYENLFKADNSWTMSYSLKDKGWIGWHSYRPNFYMYASDRFYSWINGVDNIYRHNVKGKYQTYYGQYYPHIIEFVSLSSPLTTRIWDYLRFQTEARQYSATHETYVDKRLITHNKLLVYNTRQCSGVLNLIVKDSQASPEEYLNQQVVSNPNGSILIDRNERDWSVNDFRDIRTDYDLPMFNKSLAYRQPQYYIDKVVNLDSVSFDKHWSELESFRDKFLVVRFIFDNFDDIQIITNYSIEYEQPSPR
jgi:hypothetical protein